MRESELIARKIAVEKVRKKDFSFDPEVQDIEDKLAASLGTRVHIERKEVGGKLHIDFFSKDDLRMILDLLDKKREKGIGEQLQVEQISAATPIEISSQTETEKPKTDKLEDERTPAEIKEEENTDGLYSVTGFSI